MCENYHLFEMRNQYGLILFFRTEFQTGYGTNRSKSSKRFVVLKAEISFDVFPRLYVMIVSLMPYSFSVKLTSFTAWFSLQLAHYYCDFFLLFESKFRVRFGSRYLLQASFLSAKAYIIPSQIGIAAHQL